MILHEGKVYGLTPEVLAKYADEIEALVQRPTVNWPWTERNELEEWRPEDGYED